MCIIIHIHIIMMQSVTFFETLDELQRLTGLNRDQLWSAGFNLDDWSFGFAAPTEWHTWGTTHPYYEFQMLLWFDNYACGYEHVECNGWHYYMLYHA